MITDISFIKLKQIPDERGKVLHMIRNDSPFFTSFGEIYFSIINPGIIKAWKRHLKMTQHITVPYGMIRLVIYDSRQESPTKGQIDIFDIGENNYGLVIIPPLLWYGFKCLTSYPSLIANCTDIPHDPNELEKLPLENPTIPYRW